MGKLSLDWTKYWVKEAGVLIPEPAHSGPNKG